MAIFKLFLQFASVIGGVAATSVVIVNTTSFSTKKEANISNKSNVADDSQMFGNAYHYLFSFLRESENQQEPQPPSNQNHASNSEITLENYKCLIIKLSRPSTQELSTKNTIVDCEIFSTNSPTEQRPNYSKINTAFLKSKASVIAKNSVISTNKDYMLKIPATIDINNVETINLISNPDQTKPVGIFNAKIPIIWKDGKINTNKYLTQVIEKQNDAPASKLTCNIKNNTFENCSFYNNTFISSVDSISSSSIQSLTKILTTSLSNNVFSAGKIIFVDSKMHTEDLNKKDIITISDSFTNPNNVKSLEVLIPILANTNTNTFESIVFIE